MVAFGGAVGWWRHMVLSNSDYMNTVAARISTNLLTLQTVLGSYKMAGHHCLDLDSNDKLIALGFF